MSTHKFSTDVGICKKVKYNSLDGYKDDILLAKLPNDTFSVIMQTPNGIAWESICMDLVSANSVYYSVIKRPDKYSEPIDKYKNDSHDS